MYQLTPSVYVFTHQYLNTMQQGIQTAHVLSEIFLNGHDSFNLDAMEWARDYKTLRILNAGSGDIFNENFENFIYFAEKYQFLGGYFREPDINDMVTGFGFVMSPNVINEIERDRTEYEAEGVDAVLGPHPFTAYLQKFSRAV